jgi:FkbM family methyltransferase
MKYKVLLVLWLKKRFRNLYYFFKEGSITVIDEPSVLKGYRWIESRKFGIAYSRGFYEVDLLKCLFKLLKEDSIFFDIGANAGYISLYASRLASKVYAFEPDESNLKFINQIVKLNSIKNLQVFHGAVGSEPGRLLFERGKTSATGKISEQGTIPVEVISVDEFVKSNAIEKVDLVKIDVEGFGSEVLKGMVSTLQNKRPKIIFEGHNDIELNSFWQIDKWGYAFYDADLKRTTSKFSSSNFLIAVPDEKMEN